MTLNSYAKLNLFLKVLNLRKDKYHNIKTLFERIDLADTIILKSSPGKLIKTSSNNPKVPADSTNLCYRSAKLLQDTFRLNKGVQIRIIKRIPVGSGMGGGSSNAAAVLLGLNKLWKLNLSRKKLAQLAKSIGADVPFFIYDTPFALGSGRGDEIKPLATLKDVRLWHILVVPKISVSTPLIYKKWDTFSKYSGLTKPFSNVKILFSGLRKNSFFLKDNLLYNSLEAVTMKLYPQVRRIKEKLEAQGVKSILMSGSGPAVSGILTSRKEAVLLKRQLRKNSAWQVFVARTH